MLKTLLKATMQVGRATVFCVGLVVVLVVMLGTATTALAAVPGDPFRLGKTNAVNAVTTLLGSRAGRAMLLVDNNSAEAKSRALDLRVEPDRAPLTVNASAGKATNLDADTVDGKSAVEIGVNGLEHVEATSAFDSVSSKSAQARCPAGKLVVGTGADLTGAKSGPSGNLLTDVVIDAIDPGESAVFVEAFEVEPTNLNWSLKAIAICAGEP